MSDMHQISAQAFSPMIKDDEKIKVSSKSKNANRDTAESWNLKLQNRLVTCDDK